jgi:hypothetical protein
MGLPCLHLTLQGAHQGAYDPYTLAPLAQTLSSVHLSGSNSLSLLLSLTECSNMQQLQLQGVRGVAGAPELMVQIVHSMPLLRELKLAVIQAPNLQRVRVLVGRQLRTQGRALLWAAMPACFRNPHVSGTHMNCGTVKLTDACTIV